MEQVKRKIFNELNKFNYKIKKITYLNYYRTINESFNDFNTIKIQLKIEFDGAGRG